MKKLISWTILIFLIVYSVMAIRGCNSNGDNNSTTNRTKGIFIEVIESRYSVKDGVDRFEKLLDENGLSLFQIIDHAQNAKNVNLHLLPETVVVFGNPKMASLLMKCNPSIGMDLPLKMLFYSDYEGKNWVSYTNPEYYTLKHNIKDKQCLEIIRKAHIALQILASEVSDNNRTE
ncbi:MAG: DUF302 domain-containing protein [Sulfurovum sp.]|nr:DUF302 domain-containing protein [Sulfurovaceae bacterium]